MLRLFSAIFFSALLSPLIKAELLMIEGSFNEAMVNSGHRVVFHLSI